MDPELKRLFDSLYDAIAHSDDSAAITIVKNMMSLKRLLFIHEFLLKLLNHLLSQKKCVIARLYFEITSVLYLFEAIIPLL